MVLCSKLNIDAVANLAKASHENNAKVVHISTDYVFDGFNYKPYTEGDRTGPKSVYGTTKLEGERTILELAPESIGIRK